MTEKLKVSREVADAIEKTVTEGSDFRTVIERHIGVLDCENVDYALGYEPLETLSVEQLATALIVGYEVEMTPREYVTKHYNIAKRNKKESLEKGDIEPAMLNRGVMVGIKRTLRAFQITVEGVNDYDN